MKNKDEIIHVPIDGTLDLHMFAPREVADLLEEYIRACIEKEIYEIKIIHGKGKGILRSKVHSILKKHPLVREYRLDSGASGWGASLAYLKREADP